VQGARLKIHSDLNELISAISKRAPEICFDRAICTISGERYRKLLENE
jgi:hypothetical protein